MWTAISVMFVVNGCRVWLTFNSVPGFQGTGVVGVQTLKTVPLFPQGTPSTEEDLDLRIAQPRQEHLPTLSLPALQVGNDDGRQRIFPVLGFVYGLEGIRICASIDVDNSFVTAKLAGVHSIAGRPYRRHMPLEARILECNFKLVGVQPARPNHQVKPARRS